MGITPISALAIEAQVIEVLCTCFDPEIPVNIYDLGLIYEINVDASGAVRIKMTLTSPGCPVAQSLLAEVTSKVQAIPSVTAAKVEVVWDPLGIQAKCLKRLSSSSGSYEENRKLHRLEEQGVIIEATDNVPVRTLYQIRREGSSKVLETNLQLLGG